MHFYRALTRSYVICTSVSQTPRTLARTQLDNINISFALISIFAYFFMRSSHAPSLAGSSHRFRGFSLCFL